MPILTTKQIDEVLNNPPGEISKPTWKAVQNFLQRIKAGRLKPRIGRKRIYEGDRRERNNLAARNYRKNKIVSVIDAKTSE